MEKLKGGVIQHYPSNKVCFLCVMFNNGNRNIIINVILLLETTERCFYKF